MGVRLNRGFGEIHGSAGILGHDLGHRITAMLVQPHVRSFSVRCYSCKRQVEIHTRTMAIPLPHGLRRVQRPYA
jgi:hypothetical protein